MLGPAVSIGVGTRQRRSFVKEVMAGSVTAIHTFGKAFFMERGSLIANVLRLSALGLVSWLLSPLTRPPGCRGLGTR